MLGCCKRFKRHTERFNTAAKTVHKRYGTSSNAAVLETFEQERTVAAMAARTKSTSTNARPGARTRRPTAH